MKSYAMRFISGKYQGGEFPLPPDSEIIVGRASELDMVLVEDMVSRRHAKILVAGDEVTIEDLGSTNGTFVNGERVKRMTLSDGDRVLIGTSIIKLVTVDAATQKVAPQPQPRLEEVAAGRRTNHARSMSGAIEEVPLPDLLQLFGSSRKTGLLVVKTDGDVGKIYLEQGMVAFATINDSPTVPPKKAAHRVVAWQRGLFYMEPMDRIDVPENLSLPAEAALMEAMRIFDEVNRSELPPLRSEVDIPSPLEPPLRDLSGDELEVFQACMQYKTLESVLNNCALDDVKVAHGLKRLLDAGYIETTEPVE
jgi:hypothetical protein